MLTGSRRPRPIDIVPEPIQEGVSRGLLRRVSACCSENAVLILAAHWRSLGKKRSTPVFSGTAEAAKRTVRLASARSCSRTGTLRLISSTSRRGGGGGWVPPALV